MRIRHWIAWGLLVFVILGIGGVAYGFNAVGYEKYIVKTGSMVPELNPGDLVIDKPTKDGYKVGDIITFRHGEGADVVTHRIIQITPDGIKTKGDANPTPDVWTIPPDFVQGVAAFSIPKGGYVVLFLGQPAGLGAVLIAVAGLVLLWRLFFPDEENAGSAEAPDAAISSDATEPPEAPDSLDEQVTDEPGAGAQRDSVAVAAGVAGFDASPWNADASFGVPVTDWSPDGMPTAEPGLHATIATGDSPVGGAAPQPGRHSVL